MQTMRSDDLISRMSSFPILLVIFTFFSAVFYLEINSANAGAKYSCMRNSGCVDVSSKTRNRTVSTKSSIETPNGLRPSNLGDSQLIQGGVSSDIRPDQLELEDSSPSSENQIISTQPQWSRDYLNDSELQVVCKSHNPVALQVTEGLCNANTGGPRPTLSLKVSDQEVLGLLKTSRVFETAVIQIAKAGDTRAQDLFLRYAATLSLRNYDIHFVKNLYFYAVSVKRLPVEVQKKLESLQPRATTYQDLLAERQIWFLRDCDSVETLRNFLKTDSLLLEAILQLQRNGRHDFQVYATQALESVKLLDYRDKLHSFDLDSPKGYASLDESIATDPSFLRALEHLSALGDIRAISTLEKRKSLPDHTAWFVETFNRISEKNLESHLALDQLFREFAARYVQLLQQGKEDQNLHEALNSAVAVMDLAQSELDSPVKVAAQKTVERLDREKHPYVQERLGLRCTITNLD